MNIKLKPYGEYKDTNHPCFGEIPSHWKILRNGQIFSQRNQTGFPELPILEVSLKTGVRIRDFDNSKRKQVIDNRAMYKLSIKGDIAYNMMRMWQGAVGVAPVDGLVSPAYVVASPLLKVNSLYYSYLFRTQNYMNEVNKYSYGIVTDRNRLYWDAFKRMPSLLPPIDEQNQIVKYLEFQVSKINKFIKSKKKLISALIEQKAVIISEAVTKGINSNITMRPSGIESLGEIPAHWETIKIKYISKFLNGFAFNGDDLSQDKSKSVIRIGDIKNETIDYKNALRVNPDNYNKLELENFKILKNDILIAMSGATTGKTGFVSKDIDAFINQRVGIVRCFREDPYYIFCCLQVNSFFEYIKIKANGGAQENISANDIISFCIPLPPIVEQKQIVVYIREEAEKIEKSINKIKKQIDLIIEYRNRLILDVVTGKIDVRDIVVSDIVVDEDIIEMEVDELIKDEDLESEECEV